MTQPLKVKRLDSPLSRDARPQPTRSGDTPTASPPVKPAPSRAHRANIAPAAAQSAEPTETSALPEPPPIGEPLELLSTRLPGSLRRSLGDLTAALRTQGGAQLSQKSLPEQEVLAVLIWAAGSADDPDAVDRLAANVKAFRARRYAAAAEALSS
jgi:hypothetical protein